MRFARTTAKSDQPFPNDCLDIPHDAAPPVPPNWYRSVLLCVSRSLDPILSPSKIYVNSVQSGMRIWPALLTPGLQCLGELQIFQKLGHAWLRFRILRRKSRDQRIGLATYPQDLGQAAMAVVHADGGRLLAESPCVPLQHSICVSPPPASQRSIGRDAARTKTKAQCMAGLVRSDF